MMAAALLTFGVRVSGDARTMAASYGLAPVARAPLLSPRRTAMASFGSPPCHRGPAQRLRGGRMGPRWPRLSGRELEGLALLAVSVALEVVATTSLRFAALAGAPHAPAAGRGPKACRLPRLAWVAVAAACNGADLLVFPMVLLRLSMALAYGAWAGLSLGCAAVVGALAFKERIGPARGCCLALVVIGLAGLAALEGQD